MRPRDSGGDTNSAFYILFLFVRIVQYGNGGGDINACIIFKIWQGMLIHFLCALTLSNNKSKLYNSCFFFKLA